MFVKKTIFCIDLFKLEIQIQKQLFFSIRILLDVLLCSIAEYFYELCCIFNIQTSKNSQRYYTTKPLIRDLLSNTPNCFFVT